MVRKAIVAALLSSLCSLATAGETGGYVTDARGEVVKSGYGLCWRTGYWTPAHATKECDPDLVAKEDDKVVAKRFVTVKKVVHEMVKDTKTLEIRVLFEFDKATVTKEGREALAKWFAEVNCNKDFTLTVAGHADRIGSDARNEKLSRERSDAVAAILRGLGADAKSITQEAHSNKRPVTGDECRGLGAENRRNKKLVACLAPDRRAEVGARVEYDRSVEREVEETVEEPGRQ